MQAEAPVDTKTPESVQFFASPRALIEKPPSRTANREGVSYFHWCLSGRHLSLKFIPAGLIAPIFNSRTPILIPRGAAGFPPKPPRYSTVKRHFRTQFESRKQLNLGGIWNGLGYNTHIYHLEMVFVLYEFVRLSNQRFFRAGNIQELLVISS